MEPQQPPRCPAHGPMHLRLACDPATCNPAVIAAWTCHGFDGEGCGLIVLHCSGCAETWTENDPDDCSCTCTDTTDPMYETWTVIAPTC